jgi:DNA-binding NtrC family response regulator
MGQSTPLKGQQILVVEDDYLVGITLIDMLEEAGAIGLGPVGRVDEALAYVEENVTKIDGVVLDINLHGRRSYPVADILSAQGIRFVFTTGYDAGAVEANYRAYPRCQKPCRIDALVAALSKSAE